MRVAPPVVIDSSQKAVLEQGTRSRSLPARQVERASVVLLASEGKTDLEIAAELRIGNHAELRIGNHKVARYVNDFEKTKEGETVYTPTPVPADKIEMLDGASPWDPTKVVYIFISKPADISKT